MPLTRDTAIAIVSSVAGDRTCVNIIHSAYSMLPWGAAGSARNLVNSTRDSFSYIGSSGVTGVLANWWRLVTGNAPADKTYSDDTKLHMCFTIKNEACRAIQANLKKYHATDNSDYTREFRKIMKGLEPIKSVLTSLECTGEGHTAPGVLLTDGSQYVFDWWMTLDITNPIIWKPNDWKPLPGLSDMIHPMQVAAYLRKGIPYQTFIGNG